MGSNLTQHDLIVQAVTPSPLQHARDIETWHEPCLVILNQPALTSINPEPARGIGEAQLKTPSFQHVHLTVASLNLLLNILIPCP